MNKPQSFSEKYGYKKTISKIQIEEMDNKLRTAIWNFIYKIILPIMPNETYFSDDSDTGKLLLQLWENYFHEPIDEYENDYFTWVDYLKEYIMESNWYEVYDLLEYIIDHHYPKVFPEQNKELELINKILEENCSGYRIIGFSISPIIDKQEINTIDNILNDNSINQIVKLQIEEALNKLSDRKKPDFRGSIKDSINAIETLCKILTKDEKIQLKEALKFFESKTGVDLHPALKESFIKLYGWTSDAEGIRHCLMDYPNLNFAEAKFMLVSCSAFINLLMDKYKNIS